MSSWCLKEFKDWRYSQSCWYFRPLVWTSAPLTFLTGWPSRLPCVSKYRGIFIQRVTEWRDLRQINTCRQIHLQCLASVLGLFFAKTGLLNSGTWFNLELTQKVASCRGSDNYCTVAIIEWVNLEKLLLYTHQHSAITCILLPFFTFWVQFFSFHCER
jgi:hypothetical protein